MLACNSAADVIYHDGDPDKKPYLNKNNVVTDSDICIRIPFLCCSYHYPIYLSYFIHNACFFMMQLYGDQ